MSDFRLTEVPGLVVGGDITRLEEATAAAAEALIPRYDLVCDGTDNFETRFLLGDACHLLARPLVSAASSVSRSRPVSPTIQRLTVRSTDPGSKTGGATHSFIWQ